MCPICETILNLLFVAYIACFMISHCLHPEIGKRRVQMGATGIRRSSLRGDVGEVPGCGVSAVLIVQGYIDTSLIDIWDGRLRRRNAYGPFL
ncbi:uncharacterized protein EDB93DRAFT_1166127 [Suillus bovinus]|uniref:uncharacterized protein n=1 Tax=Suillus bovinus TaxID=48563 RepID=UPI001B87D395|nr:uncharacterized protein EDB93DRAFT_1166127 [Suillus bovinus]KAG2137834.1 hypothetical protein EDB93DRAFT_1166127 [Suillus bovinus]